MRVLQFTKAYHAYIKDFDRRHPSAGTLGYERRHRLMLEDGFLAIHVLGPAYVPGSDVKFVVENDSKAQSLWAQEKGMSSRDPFDILLAQIEEHRAEVIYTLNATPFAGAFLKRLPGCVKHSVCWHASPTRGVDLSGYSLRVCNFPNFLSEWESNGLRCAWFDPAYDPAMAGHAANEDRPIDIAFAGQFSAHHSERNQFLERVAGFAGKYNARFALLHPRWKPILDVRVIRRIPTFIPYLPRALRPISQAAVYGVGMYELFGKSKIVINAAIDVAGGFRGNMRCFEAMGCGACMLSDSGSYPSGFKPGEQFETFANPTEACERIEALLSSPDRRRAMARRGHDFIASTFTRDRQWRRFRELVGTL